VNRKTVGISFASSAAALLLATVAAETAPARVVNGTNLRQGPGLDFGIIATIPANAPVEVTGCNGQWCTVQWGPRGGYVVAKNLDRTALVPIGPGEPPAVVGPPVVVESGPIVVGPPAVYVGPGFYWGPRWGYGWGRW
jgi:uncharacterized protein YraI